MATAAALIAGLLIVLFALPPLGRGVLTAALVLLAAYEWALLCPMRMRFAMTYAAFCTATFVILLRFGDSSDWWMATVAAITFWLVIAPLWLWRGLQGAPAALVAATGWVVIVPAALMFATTTPGWLLGVLALIWIADIAAYFVGSAFGRRRLAPRISPGKTWEGVAAGVLGALGYAIICGIFIERLPWMLYLAAAMVVTVLSIVGDLFESALKRRVGVKDSGTLLPGHGGILDRVDSLLAALPVAALLLPMVKGAT